MSQTDPFKNKKLKNKLRDLELYNVQPILADAVAANGTTSPIALNKAAKLADIKVENSMLKYYPAAKALLIRDLAQEVGNYDDKMHQAYQNALNSVRRTKKSIDTIHNEFLKKKEQLANDTGSTQQSKSSCSVPPKMPTPKKPQPAVKQHSLSVQPPEPAPTCKKDLSQNILFSSIDSLHSLKMVMNTNVAAIDFEFSEGCQPIAYGLSVENQSSGYQFSNRKQTKKTACLDKSNTEGFMLLLAKLSDRGYRTLITFGTNDLKCLQNLYEAKKQQSPLPTINVLDPQPVLASVIDDGQKMRPVGLMDIAMFIDVDLYGVIAHNPTDDASVLYEVASRVSKLNNEEFVFIKTHYAGFEREKSSLL